jgi:serine/threonine protein kinase
VRDAARWRRVEEICGGALERTGDERTAFVAAACGDDEALRQEVEALLAREAAGEGFLTASIGTLAAQVFGVPATLAEGTRFGSYEIGTRIGAGGMGVVYRATDTTLGRQVAIKVLSSAFANDPERLARFEREARTLASLNHPHIAQVYGLEQANGIRALVMEWVEGQDLSQLIVGRPKPVNEVLAIARQIAEALEAAHEQRIIHRDLKPANIRVRPDGVVKVLDFGLAKVSTRHAAIQSGDVPFARTPSATELGLILGTPAYMSPEQAKGHAIDTRTDIWAFGAVLYEMLTGMRAFDGPTVIETLASVIAGVPDYSTLPAGTPSRLRHLVQRCLERDVTMRLRDIGEARIALSRLESDAIDKEAAEPLRPFPSGRAAWSARAHFQLALPSGVELDFPAGGSISVSPDGRYIVFVAVSDGRRALWLRPIDSTEARLLPGTERASLPFWSPDSAFVAFFADSKLKTLEVRTGIVHVIFDASPTPGGGAWSRQGVIVFAPDIEGRWAGSASREPMLDGPTRESMHLFRVVRVAAMWPAFLPDGNHYVFQALGLTNPGIYLDEIDDWSSQCTRLIRQDSFDMTAARYASGHLLFVRNHALVAQPFDTRSLKLSGDAFPLAQGFGIGALGTPDFDVSDNGVLVFRKEGAHPTFQLTWFGADGARKGTLGEPGPYRSFDLSPDGRTLAVDQFMEKETFIWLMDIRRGVSRRFTADAMSFAPRWSPQGDRLAFESVRDTPPNPFVRTLGGAEQRLVRLPATVRVTSWSPDGRLLIGHFRGDRGMGSFDDLWLFSASGEERPLVFLETPFHKRDATVSPDGRWVAFASDEGGTSEIYVTTFPTTGRRTLRVSSGGGEVPRWRDDGKELFFQANDSIMAASAASTAAGSLKIGIPRELFTLPADAGFWIPAPRRRFLVSVPVTKAIPAPIQVVINWNSRTDPTAP